MLVLIAALNEEEGIGPTIAELQNVLDARYVVVDGNSTDKTVDVAKELGAQVLYQNGFGKGQAIAQAIGCIPSDVEYVVFIDADFTYPAGCVPKMLTILEKNPEVGMVTGNRFYLPLQLGSMKSLFFIGNRFLALAQRVLNGVNLRDPLTGLRIVRRKILKGWYPRSKGFDIEAEMNHLVEKKGYKTVESPIPYRSRMGVKKLKLRHGFLILRRIIIESFSHRKYEEPVSAEIIGDNVN